MKAILQIELRGDNTRQLHRLFVNIIDDQVKGLGRSLLGSWPPSGWCAEIIGFDPKYKFARNFLRYKKDYSRSNSTGSRGVMAEYVLESGKLYEAREHSKHFFCTVNNDGDIVKIPESEVEQWIKSHSASTSTTPLKIV